MTDRKRQNISSLVLTVVLVGLNLAAANYLLSGWSTARIDLTEEGMFSISPATRRLLTELDEDLTIYGYFSGRTHPKLAPLVPEIRDLLEEYRAVSRGKVNVEIFDPSEDEAVAEEASDRYGVQSSPFRLTSKYEAGIVNAFFAVVIKYGDQYERYGFQDLIEVEPLPDGDIEVKLRNLEYDLTRAIKKVVYGFRSTNELFGRVERPVRLTGVISQSTLPEIFVEVPQALRDAAEQLAETGGDKFVFEELDPLEDESARARVEQSWGLSPLTLGLFGGGEQFYLYAILDVGGQLEQVPLTDAEITPATIRETVENALRRNTPGFLKTVGIVAPAPMQVPPQLQFQMRQPPPEFEEIKRFLGQDYQVKDVKLDDAGGVPTDVDVLVVLKPRDLDEKAVFHLDQYVMRGGRLILCSSRYDSDFNAASGLRVNPRKTGLEDWLANYGVDVRETLVLDDRNQALPIPELRNTPLGTIRTWTLAPYPYLVQVVDDGFVNRDVTATLNSVGIYWGSPIEVDQERSGELEVLPILRSSERSWTDDDTSRVGFVEYDVPAEGTEPQLLAVALTGRFQSYYADRDVPRFDGGNDAGDADGERAEGETAEAPTLALKQSPETRIVIVGDSSFLSDLVARSLGQLEGGFFAENLTFAQNLIDWISLDNEMLQIRARGLVSRRLDPIEKGTKNALEIASYAIPIVLLLALAFQLRWKRRHTVPLFPEAGATRPGPAVRSHKEA